MKIVKLNKVPKIPFIDPLFTGSDVTRQMLVSDSKDLNLYIVNFGKGIVATEKENRVVTIGDIVVFPAGEKHWHGATEDSEFSHIVITKGGVKFAPAED